MKKLLILLLLTGCQVKDIEPKQVKYYRLKIVNNDGSIEYSKIIAE